MRRRTAALLAAGAVLVTAVTLTSIVQATHSPANKVWVAASGLDWLNTALQVGDGANVVADDIVLAKASAKFSNPTDLRISVTSECALWTNTATTGDDDSEAKARVEYWIEIDGLVVPVSADDEPAPASNDPDERATTGHVVFCNRAARMKTEFIETGFPGCVDDECAEPDADDEDDIRIRSYNRTRTANAFNWGALDVGRDYDVDGDNRLTIELHARLAAQVIDEVAENSDESDENNGVDSPAAMAAIGKRTMFIEPVKMANDAAF